MASEVAVCPRWLNDPGENDAIQKPKFATNLAYPFTTYKRRKMTQLWVDEIDPTVKIDPTNFEIDPTITF